MTKEKSLNPKLLSTGKITLKKIRRDDCTSVDTEVSFWISILSTTDGTKILPHPGSADDLTEEQFDLFYGLSRALRESSPGEVSKVISDSAVKEIDLENYLKSQWPIASMSSKVTMSINIDNVEVKAKLVSRRLTNIIFGR